MGNLSAALIYLGFFGLIGFAVWMTGSLTPLWALILAPAINTSSKDGDNN